MRVRVGRRKERGEGGGRKRRGREEEGERERAWESGPVAEREDSREIHS